MENGNNKDDRLADAKERIAARKAYLAELNQIADKTLLGEDRSVQNRLQKLSKGKDEEDKRPTTEKAKAPLNLAELTKSLGKNAEKLDKEGLTKDKPDLTSNKKDDKDKKKDKENSAEKNRDEQKAQVLSTIKLPSGARIVEHANKWEIVSEDKNGKEVATDITDVMNKIDSFNSLVNDINKENSQKTDAPTYSAKDKADAIESKLPNVRDDEVKMTADFKQPDQISEKDIPTFKPEDMKELADYAISMADAGKLYKQVKDRNRKNESEKDDKNHMMAMARKSGHTH